MFSIRIQLSRALLGACLALLVPPDAAFAAAAETREPVVTPEPPPIPDTLRTPRATMQAFLAAMTAVRAGEQAALADAAATLDLDEINPLVRPEKGAELAWLLAEALEFTGTPEPQRIPRRTTGKPFVFQEYDEGRIAIAFEEDVGWRFAADTVAALPAIVDDLIARREAAGERVDRGTLPLPLRLRASVPAELRETTLVLEHWQWLGILIVILAGIVLDKLAAVALASGVRVWRARYGDGAFRLLDDAVLRPLALLVMALAWWSGLNLLSLPASALVVLLVSTKFLACLAGVWGAYRLVDVLSAYLEGKALRTSSRVDDALVPLVTKTIKVFVTVMGVVFIADNLDIDVTSLLAGLGLGGLAFALAAKDVAGNLFGSITVLLDQTFHVGDWVKIGDVEGTVERIGFRSTRIRTFYNSLVSVPNSTLITANVDNLGARQYRRLSCKFGIAYDTPPERIEAFCAGLREVVLQHPYMRKDNFHIYLNGLGASSLEILVYVFWKTPDWSTELRERHRFLIDALRLARRLGVEYAFPTQTLFMRQGEDTPLPVPAGEFAMPESDAAAQARGRAEAQAIVAATLAPATATPGNGSQHGAAGE